jgi:hypothetical protein
MNGITGMYGVKVATAASAVVLRLGHGHADAARWIGAVGQLPAN